MTRLPAAPLLAQEVAVTARMQAMTAAPSLWQLGRRFATVVTAGYTLASSALARNRGGRRALLACSKA